MFDPKQFDELANKLFATLPTSLQNFEKDIQQKFKEVLQSTFSRMDLVTREEFDVQCKVLARTREKLEQLQHQLEDFIKRQEIKNNK
ncbi:TPA: accessory factor UbiK family protein [Legionella pneumophila]|uniref:ubiquinone biosynthesis accessory factor UbiK n=1 Tax=Legionella sp. PATHC039 TaxID=2992042 RepID=UPI000778470C|nr:MULTISPECIES: accessory factor UbiK family protein [Legionella]HAT8860147.1 accessory factor UbiK family protein [Legionella pneumophila subsp. pneumophila]MCW8395787.1 accessory factor UbiK family protein [Legionella sp. PATHC039]HAT7072584.1 accessory factor UbiK family protein [Legionella pneumophila]HAT8642223.1 accessory factor UbiK family protein [Legionella pneumophila]HAT8868651.1 accessory factor UbiK family protein [Legionella pneumophila subsp. pneumophila]